MNVKPGDLARIVSDQFNPENVGKVVAVECRFESGALTTPEGAPIPPAWVTTALQNLRCFKVGSYTERITVYAGHRIAILDRNLRPIRPGELDEPRITEKDLEAV